MRIPCVIMRGGTSKCVTFHARDLPSDTELRDRILLSVMGSPDPRQIDGLGGSYSTTSKVCIIGPPSVPEADVDYTFAQVSISAPLVDYKGNCGNCSASVGPFAIDEGLVRAVEPVTTVHIYNTNTKKTIRAEVAVRDSRFYPEGDTYISGVPNPGSRIVLWFDSPGGAVTGRLLPTGNPVDVMEVPGLGTARVSIIDAANPVVFIRGENLGVAGTESPAVLDADKEFCRKIEAVRGAAAVLCGLATDAEEATIRSPAVPKVAFVMPPQDYSTLTGDTVTADAMDLLARIMSMQTCHRAYALTGAVATCAAAFIPKTVVHEIVLPAILTACRLRLGHPSGTMELKASVAVGPDGVEVRSIGSVRTARRLMEGHVYVPDAIVAGRTQP
ncbi:MAG: 3-methylitaconate isomerase [Acidobacteria bacterium]|nr:3-methylitaconate isomerase [Acidobacteriota bacterium]